MDVKFDIWRRFTCIQVTFYIIQTACFNFVLQRTTDPDAIELYIKKVKIIDKKTGNVTLNYEKPPKGVEMIKAGGI